MSEEQASKQHTSTVSVSAPVSKVPTLTSFNDKLCCLSVSEINPFLPKLVLVLVFHHINKTLTKTELEIISFKSHIVCYPCLL